MFFGFNLDFIYSMWCWGLVTLVDIWGYSKLIEKINKEVKFIN